MKQNWAILGLGFISPKHFQAIQAIGDRVTVTCDIDEMKGAIFENADHMYRDSLFKAVDNVAICTPNMMHVSTVQKCLALGKRVLCEKPLGIESHSVKKLPNDGSVYTVLQLRHHPEVKRLKTLKSPSRVSLDIRVPRGSSYWEGWKGDPIKSGGMLFNIGVHYFDLLIHLFGNDYTIVQKKKGTDRLKTGIIGFDDGPIVDYQIEIIPDGEKGKRVIVFDKEEILLSDKDSLAGENLHTQVYREFKRYRGVTPKEALKSIEMIERL